MNLQTNFQVSFRDKWNRFLMARCMYSDISSDFQRERERENFLGKIATELKPEREGIDQREPERARESQRERERIETSIC